MFSLFHLHCEAARSPHFCARSALMFAYLSATDGTCSTAPTGGCERPSKQPDLPPSALSEGHAGAAAGSQFQHMDRHRRCCPHRLALVLPHPRLHCLAVQDRAAMIALSSLAPMATLRMLGLAHACCVYDFLIIWATRGRARLRASDSLSSVALLGSSECPLQP